jgi:hypothetical protein
MSRKIEKNEKSNKLPYCPIISQFLKKANNEILKKPILYEILSYVELDEQLEARLVCRQWDEIVKTLRPELNDDNLFDNTYKRKYNSNNFFDNSDEKFSKKRVLVHLLHSKNYGVIKSRASLKGMTKAKNLID